MNTKISYLLVLLGALALFWFTVDKQVVRASAPYAPLSQGSATLLIKKVGVGGTGSFQFTLTATVTPGEQIVNVASGGESAPLALQVGESYMLAESVPTGWQLTSVACDSQLGPDISATTNNPITLPEIISGDTITCTYTNTRLGTIIVRKATSPASSQTFQFQSNFGGSFSLSDGGSEPFADLIPGAYSITESVPAGWDVAVSCSNGVNTNPANITLNPGQTVECTFTNTQRGTIIVRKVTSPASSQVFTFQRSFGANFTLTNGTSQPFANLAPGQYQVSETVPAGWSLAATCSDGVVSNINPANITLAAGATVDCTFTNTQLGRIIVRKVTTPASSQSFTFQRSFGGNFNLTNGMNRNFNNLAPGPYWVSETVPAGWSLAATCSDGVVNTIDPANITLAAGVTVDCTFANTAQPMGVQIVKSATPIKAAPGSLITYQYTVTNTALFSLALHNVVVSDDKCSPLVGPSGDLLGDALLFPLEKWVYTCTTTLTSDTLNTATVTAQDFVNRTVNHTATAYVDILPTVKLGKRVTPSARPEPGGLFTYTLTITNTATEAVQIIGLTDTYPLSSACNALLTAPTLNLDPGEVVSCAYTVNLTQLGAYLNEAAVTVSEMTLSHPSDTLDVASAQATATAMVVNLPSSLTVAKRAQPTALSAPGGTVTFMLVVTNTSAVDVITLTTIKEDETNDGSDDLTLTASEQCTTTTLAPGATTTCIFQRSVTGALGVYTSKSTVTALDDDNQTIQSSATATVHLVGTALFQVDKQPDRATIAEPGGDVTFNVTIANNHPAAVLVLTSLQDSIYGDVTSAGHDAISSTTCTLASVPAGGVYTCVFTALVSGQPGDLHQNTLSAVAVDNDSKQQISQSSAQVLLTNLPAALAVTKTPNPLSVSEAGGMVTFTVQVRNSSVADSVTLTQFVDSLYGDLAGADTPVANNTCTPGQTLAVGAVYTCTFSAMITGELGSAHHNTLTVSGVDDDGDAVQGVGSASVFVINALAAANKRAELFEDLNQDGVANPGETLAYTIVISNVGNESGVFRFSDVLDANTTPIAESLSASMGVIEQTASGFAVDAMALAVGESTTITFQARIKDPLPAGVNSVANQGLVTSPDAPTVATDDPTTLAHEDATVTAVGANPLVVVTKRDRLVEEIIEDQIAGPGDVVEYEVLVTNNGNQAATGLVLDDRPDANTTLVAGSVVAGAGAQVVIGNGAGDRRVQVTLPDPFGVGAQAVITFRVQVNPTLPVDTTTISNQAIVTGLDLNPILSDDPDTTGQNDTTKTPLAGAPVLRLTKSDALLVDADEDGWPSPGDTLVYQLSLHNSGTASATDVVLTDLLDANTVLVAGSIQRTQGQVVSGNKLGDTSVQVNVGALAANGTITISYHAVIANPLPVGVSQVENQASASGANFATLLSDDPTTEAQYDATVTTVTATPVLVVSKRDFLYQDADNDNEVSAGDTLLYVIQVVNDGNAPAANVRLIDTPDPQTALDAGKVQTSRGAVVLGNDAADATVEIDLGALAPKSTAVVGIRVIIQPGAVTHISNQAVVEYTNPNDPATGVITVESDDPDTAAKGDLTITPLDSPASPPVDGPLHLPLIILRQ
jgi:uncharacterized repeat protein (TIGR01451 family)